jgi:hypothetical protein
MKTDLQAFLDELGEELLGAQWVYLKPILTRWLDNHPERIPWLESRIRRYAAEVSP